MLGKLLCNQLEVSSKKIDSEKPRYYAIDMIFIYQVKMHVFAEKVQFVLAIAIFFFIVVVLNCLLVFYLC
jgi:hypothetical protein